MFIERRRDYGEEIIRSNNYKCNTIHQKNETIIDLNSALIESDYKLQKGDKEIEEVCRNLDFYIVVFIPSQPFRISTIAKLSYQVNKIFPTETQYLSFKELKPIDIKEYDELQEVINFKGQ